jgi:hypothetical protein
MKRKRYLFFVLATIIVAIILIAALFPTGSDDQHNLKIELIKDLAQMCLLVIIGGILVNEYNNERDQAKKQDELKQALYIDMKRTYFKIKKVRRTMEAAVRGKDSPVNKIILYSTYEEMMQDLNDLQLEYEFYADQFDFFIKAGTFRYKETGIKLTQNIGLIEQYLNNLVEEYQQTDPTIERLNFSELSKLNDFIFNTSIFKTEFSNIHKDSIKLLEGDILKVKKAVISSPPSRK